MDYDYQLAWHVDRGSYPEWGSAPRGPLVELAMAHKGELMGSVIGMDPATGKDCVYHALRCELCIATHVFPLPSEPALTHWYATQFYEREKPGMIERYQRDALWWARCMHGPVLDTCFAALGCSPGTRPQILDVGAGPGLLLDEAKRRGWVTAAIEPSPLCCEMLALNGHAIHQGGVVDLPRGATYDVVTMWECLEHLPHPEEALLKVYDLLRPGGVVAVVVPNDWNPIQLEACAKLGLPHYWVAPPQHLFMWTPKTLQLQVRRAGFQIVDMRGTYPIDKFLLEGRNYIGNDALGRACHSERMAYEMKMVGDGKWDELEASYRANLQKRIGREIVCIARKTVS